MPYTDNTPPPLTYPMVCLRLCTCRTQQLVDILLHAFNTPTGIPWNQLNLHTHAGKNPGWTAKMSTLAGLPPNTAADHHIREGAHRTTQTAPEVYILISLCA